MKHYLAPLALAAMLSACSSVDLNAPLPDTHTSRISVDWQGTYAGDIPCADCPGIRLTLSLMNDGSYQLSRQYLEREPKPEVTRGRFEWRPDGNSIVLLGDDSRWRVGEGQLTMLDMDGNPPTGPIAQHYILRKTSK